MALKGKNMINEYILDGQFGLEKESLRVDKNGNLSHTPHPFSDMKNIDKDFCENQIEIITDVFDSVEQVYQQLRDLHNIAVKRAYHLKSGKEYIWNFSNPPYVINEDDIPIAQFRGELKGKELYREYLAQKYGRKKMLYSGIHFNFSFSEQYLNALFQQSGESVFQDFKNKLYLNLAAKVTRYGWLIVYLTAASPLMDGSYFHEEEIGKDILSKYASGRCSEIGYWNDFIPILNYHNLADYTRSIQDYVDSGQLKSLSELYYPVRLKPKGENTLKILGKSGVNHIELRNIDLNPLSDIGIKKEDIQFLHLFLVYLNIMENREFLDFEQVMAIKNIKKAALFDEQKIQIETGWNKSENIREVALKILNEMECFFDTLGNDSLREVIEYQKNKILDRKERYAVKIMNTYHKEYVKQGLQMAEEYAKNL